MSNWFETNPTKSVIVHTIIVAGASWAAFLFIYDENKVKFYEAQVETIKAEARELSARNSVLVSRLEHLKEENYKFAKWLEATPNTIPFYEKENKKLKLELEEANSNNAESPKDPQIGNPISLYKNKTFGNTATAFFDPKTQVTFGIPKINYGDTANINLTFPSGEKKELKNIGAGTTWDFSDEGKKYRVILDSIDWATQNYSTSIIELKPKSPE